MRTPLQSKHRVLREPVNVFSQLGRRFLGLAAAGRGAEVFDDDVFIVSYPKSGNTWVRFLLGNYLSLSEPVTFANVDRKLPDIHQIPARRLKKLPRPRLLKSHEYLDPRYRKVIYIVRDPRSVAVSYYHFLVKMRVLVEQCPINVYAERFIRGDLDPYGSWSDHVGGWLGARQGRKDFLLLRYEKMLENPAEELRRIIEFLGRPAGQSEISAAVAMSSFKKMRTMERKDVGKWGSVKSGRRDKPFIREGQKDGWRRELPSETVIKIEAAFFDVMRDLEYPFNGGL